MFAWKNFRVLSRRRVWCCRRHGRVRTAAGRQRRPGTQTLWILKRLKEEGTWGRNMTNHLSHFHLQLEGKQLLERLFPLIWNLKTGKPGNSAFLLHQWLLLIVSLIRINVKGVDTSQELLHFPADPLAAALPTAGGTNGRFQGFSFVYRDLYSPTSLSLLGLTAVLGLSFSNSWKHAAASACTALHSSLDLNDRLSHVCIEIRPELFA